jgi:type VI secretion system protein ImpL
MTRVHWISLPGLVVYGILVWFLGGWLGLTGAGLWILRIALWLIGLAAVAVVVQFATRAGTAAGKPDGGDLRGDVEFLVREANTRLAASHGIHKAGKDLAAVPLILFLGDAGAAKTSVIVNSGLVPEPLAGEVFKDGSVAPTRVANLWLSAGAILVEAGGPLAASPDGMRRALDLLRARTLANLLGRSGQAPRAVVICYECANFIGSNSRNAVDQAARRFRDLLGEIAHRWGSRLPVYVLVTKFDQVPYFLDYYRNLTREESEELLGVTLPLVSGEAAGTYAEQQTRRLNEAFESLFGALAEKRLEHLRRENDPARSANVYEFPREFRKMRDNFVRFLVDVGRPSQLRASPFLRGFYFTGVRPVLTDAAPAAEVVAAASYSDDPGATRLFALPARGAVRGAPLQPASSQARRVPHWAFLNSFFTKVLLADHSALGASGHDVRARLIRLGLSAAAIVLLAGWMIGASVSYVRNRGRVEEAAEAERRLAGMRTAPGQTPSVDALRSLDQLREVVAAAAADQRYRPAMSLRWGIYPGPDLYTRSAALYCREFDRLLLADARTALTDSLRRLPRAPNPGDDYQRPFDELRAYLMTTLEPRRTEAGFLSGILFNRWAVNRGLNEDQSSLARTQFAYYASERTANFCAAKPEADAVAQARAYLWQFQPVERIYRSMVADISRQGPPYVFSDPAGAVIDTQQVPFPYTKAGWPAMQAAIRERTDYYARDPWVLGDGGPAATAATADLQRQLRQRYSADYDAQWRQFLAAASIAPYSDSKDAARKLDAMTAAQSSLLRLFCDIASHTTANTDVQSALQPIQQLQPPATCAAKLNDNATQQYMGAMVALQVQVDDISKRPDPSDARLDTSNPARIAAKTTAQNLNLPAKAGELLLDPIVNAENAIGRIGPQAVNGKGNLFCQGAARVFGRFPLNPHAKEDATLADFNDVFQPNGKLAAYYQSGLQELLTSAPPYAAKAGAKFKVTPAFLNFFNQAMAISRAYSGSPARVSLPYVIQVLPSNDVESFSLQVGGKTIRNFNERQEVVWTGDDMAIHLSAKARGGQAPVDINESGPWSLFRLLADANRVAPGGTYDYEISARTSFGRQNATNNSAAVLHLRVEPRTPAGVVGMGCVSRVVQ